MSSGNLAVSTHVAPGLQSHVWILTWVLEIQTQATNSAQQGLDRLRCFLNPLITALKLVCEQSTRGWDKMGTFSHHS